MKNVLLIASVQLDGAVAAAGATSSSYMSDGPSLADPGSGTFRCSRCVRARLRALASARGRTVGRARVCVQMR